MAWYGELVPPLVAGIGRLRAISLLLAVILMPACFSGSDADQPDGEVKVTQASVIVGSYPD